MNLLFVPSTLSKIRSWAAIGVFDGLHIGHRYLLKQLKLRGGRVVFTFHPHPYDILTDKHLPLILPYERRIGMLMKMGLSPVVIEFSSSLAKMKAEEFLGEIKTRFGVTRYLVCENFTIGSDRKTAEDLPHWFEVLSPKKRAGQRISSTWIREYLSHARIEKARSLLGYWPRIWGKVIRGDGLGRQIGYPTANLDWEGDLLLCEGVYAVKVRLGSRVLMGVMSIGRRPTLGGKEMRVEIHIFDFAGDLYNRRIEVMVMEFLREQKTFSNLRCLKEAIKEDVERVKSLLL